MSDYLADRTHLVDASGIRKVFALAATMKDPVNFSIGQPDFDVPESVKAEAIRAIQSGQNSYSQTAGISELLEAVKQRTSDRFNWQRPVPLITSGVSGGLLLSLMSLINAGDEVIVADPYFVMYKHLINLLGGKCVFIDTYPDFKLSAVAIEAAITSRTKLIIVNSPSNPTGTVYSRNELRDIAEVAAKHDIIVMSDEIYDKFCYDEQCPSIAEFYNKTLLLNGFSKSHAMTGWRLGYAVVDEVLSDLIEQMTKIQQYTFVCAPRPLQAAALTAMDCDVSALVAEYKIKRDLLYDGLKDTFELNKPQGAFYAFVKVPDHMLNGTEFVKKAISNNVLVIPGNVFSEKDTHFRISYATSNGQIIKGTKLLCEIARS